MRQWLTFSLAGALAFSASVAINASEEEDSVVRTIKYRQSAFRVIVWNFAPMGAMVKGEMPYNQEDFAKKAERVSILSAMPLEGFPEGSDQGADTEAKPEIWKEWDKFKTGMEKFQTEAAARAEIAKGGDRDAIKEQFGKTAETCKACHKHFKKD